MGFRVSFSGWCYFQFHSQNCRFSTNSACQGPDFLERILRSMEFPGAWGLVGLEMSGGRLGWLVQQESQGTY